MQSCEFIYFFIFLIFFTKFSSTFFYFQEYSSQDYRTGLPLAGPVTLPADRAALLMQYSRYSNDYTDHTFPPNLSYKVNIILKRIYINNTYILVEIKTIIYISGRP